MTAETRLVNIMIEITLGSAIIYYFANRSLDIKEKPAEAVYYSEIADPREKSFTRNHREAVLIKPALENQFRGTLFDRLMTIAVVQRRLPRF